MVSSKTRSGLPHYRQIFEEEGVDDFLVLPFLRLSSLGVRSIYARMYHHLATIIRRYAHYSGGGQAHHQSCSTGSTGLPSWRLYELSLVHFYQLTEHTVVGLWIRHLGYPNYMEKFVKHQIWPQLLLVLKEEDLRLIGIKTNDVPVLWELIRSCQQFSSVEGALSINEIVR